jgi:hypothetical protein
MKNIENYGMYPTPYALNGTDKIKKVSVFAST